MNTTRIPRFLAATAVAGLVLVGCGNATETPTIGSGAAAPSPAATQGAQNEADVAFVQGMVIHHRQAVEMADLARGSTEDSQLLDLATRVSAAQGPETDTMAGWLTRWGAEVPAEDGAMAGMNHSGMSGMAGMSGMMTPEQMQELGTATSPAFDQMFLQMMLAHHAGAVEMARTVLDEGADPQVRELAETISTTQQAEITEMEALLEQG
ncbi:MAG: DUF305 domain-containing protein [Pseudonocardia sp.]|nr:DUF305 domain-containing protein [Pseudonocardia sp.]